MQVNQYASQRELKLSIVNSKCQELFDHIPENFTIEQIAQLDCAFNFSLPFNLSLPATNENAKEEIESASLTKIYLDHAQNLKAIHTNTVKEIDNVLFQMEQKLYNKLAGYFHEQSTQTCKRIESNLRAYKENKNKMSETIDPELLKSTIEFLEFLE